MKNKSKKTVLYAKAVYGEEEIAAVVDVLKNDGLALMNGRRVKEFERQVADIFGKTHGHMVNSGSSANTLAISILDLNPDDEVITPALTFSTTVAPLVQNQLVPVFVDVEEDTYVIDVEAIEALIGPKTRALMIPNLIGNIADWRRLRELGDKHDLVLIEDSCDTIGYRWNGGTTGQLSDIVTTSFYASHIITAAGFGGMVMVNDEALSKRTNLLRGWGRRSSLAGESESIDSRFHSEIDGIPYDEKFVFEDIGYNFLPSEISAAFGLQQLARLDTYTQTRKTNFKVLVDFFNDFADWFILPRQTTAADTAWLAVPLIVRDDAPFSRRDLQVFFESNGIQTRTVFTGNILRQPGYKDIKRREAPGGFPNADQVMRGGILIGCHQGMGAKETDYIQDRFLEFSKQV
jgi:CDP-6-deoxy-D-xylo-4-hexulose-3-dehydrase